MDFGPFGLSEILLIGVIVLLLFGPRRLPEMGRQAGKIVTRLRRSSSELRRAFEAEVAAAEIDASPVREIGQGLRDVSRDLGSVAASLTTGVPAPPASPPPGTDASAAPPAPSRDER